MDRGKSGSSHWILQPDMNKAENVRYLSFLRHHLISSPGYPLSFPSPAAETLPAQPVLPSPWTAREQKQRVLFAATSPERLIWVPGMVSVWNVYPKLS